MLFYMILLHVLIKLTCTKGNAGTAIFYNKHDKIGCWSEDEIAKLRARKAFEQLIPHVNPDEVDVKYIKDVLRYFRKSMNSMGNNADPRTLALLKEAVADTIGAHLRSEMLPAIRFAYYAGYVPYRSARQLHDFFDDIKTYLNTQGLGWRKPTRSFKNWSNLTVAKISIGAGTFYNPCSSLVTKRDSNSCIHFPIPKHEDNLDPSVVALPFKSGGLVSLSAPSSNNILLKYYTTASRCILSRSPRKCRHADFLSFNNELWHWMKRDVAPHLIDENLYAAYGGILRIAAAVQNYGRGLSRRNLFEYQDTYFGQTKWYPWQSLKDSYVNINTEWTPAIYVGLVFLTAFSVYLIQICYCYICGASSGDCRCKRSPWSLFSKNVAYANIDTTIPAMLPDQSVVYHSEKQRATPKPKSFSSIQTQKVFDLNENTEKMMDVIISDGEESTTKSSSSLSSAKENTVDVGTRVRSKSPPELQTSMSQLEVDKKTQAAARLPKFSVSTRTRTLTGTSREQNVTDSVWSASESTSSSRTVSSSSSKSRRTRSFRDLVWAKRVITKNSSRSVTLTRSSTRTDLGQKPTSPK